jgi:hypothetical protein
MTTRPESPPGGEWLPHALTGAGVVVRPGQRPPECTVALVRPGAESKPWWKPAQVWVENGYVRTAQWVAGDTDTGLTVSTYLEPAEGTTPNLFEKFIRLDDDRDILDIASRWGTLGICSCRWAGGADTWFGSLHPPHTVVKVGAPEPRLLVSEETLTTWLQVRDRAVATIELWIDKSDPTPAQLLGFSWPDTSDARTVIRTLALNRWARLGRLSFSNDPATPGAAFAPTVDGLLPWLALHIVHSAGTIGDSVRACKSCGKPFPYGRNRVYCTECSKAGTARRDASRRYRSRKATKPSTGG